MYAYMYLSALSGAREEHSISGN